MPRNCFRAYPRDLLLRDEDFSFSLLSATLVHVRNPGLADVATLGILQHRSQSESRSLTEQLQHALDSRVVIEQAKGILAERSRIGVDEAFSVLRGYARHQNRHLSDVAQEISDGTLETSALANPTGLAAHPDT